MNDLLIHELTERLQRIEMDSEQRRDLDTLRDVAIAENKRRIDNRQRRPVNCPPCPTSALRYGEFAGLITAVACAAILFVARNSGIVISDRPLIMLTAYMLATILATCTVMVYRNRRDRPAHDVIREPETNEPQRDTTMPQPERVTLYSYKRSGRTYHINVLRSDIKFIVDIYEENNGRMPTFSKSTWTLAASKYSQLRKVGMAKGHFILGTGNNPNKLKPAGIAHFCTILGREYKRFSASPSTAQSAESTAPFRSRSVPTSGTHENQPHPRGGGGVANQQVLTTAETAAHIITDAIMEGA